MRKNKSKIIISSLAQKQLEKLGIYISQVEFHGEGSAFRTQTTMANARRSIVEVIENGQVIYEIITHVDEPTAFNPKATCPNPFLVRATLPPEIAEDVIANLEHYFETVWQKNHGAKTARIIFYTQNFRIVVSHYIGAFRSALELYLKFKK